MTATDSIAKNDEDVAYGGFTSDYEVVLDSIVKISLLDTPVGSADIAPGTDAKTDGATM